MNKFEHEFVVILGLLGITLTVSELFGHHRTFFAFAGVLYIIWHAIHIWRLMWWLRRDRLRRSFSVGLWKGIFDDLHAMQLHNRRRKRALLDLLRQLRELAANIPDGIVLLDGASRVHWFNPAAVHLLGLNWPRDHLSWMPILLKNSTLEEQLASKEEARPVEMLSPVNGMIMLRIDVTCIHHTDQRLLVARDITKTYNMERTRREFVSNASHELRTPLTVFRGYLEILEDMAEENPELKRPAQLLCQQSDRMRDLVEDLLELSRLDYKEGSPNEQSVNVPDLLYSITDEVRSLDETSDHDVVIAIEPDLWLLGDTPTLRVAFANLIINALKHTPAGTRVRVEWLAENGEAVLRVSDNGQGIAAHHLSRLTERFYRVDPGRDRQKGGTGLGLAIVKHIVEHHGGELKIVSAPGSGSTFACHFAGPLVKSA